jgi:hypothetical protein
MADGAVTCGAGVAIDFGGDIGSNGMWGLIGGGTGVVARE